MRIAAIAAAGLLAGCVTSRPVDRYTTLTSSQIEIIKAAVQKDLKDPESARFGEIKAGFPPGQNHPTVCGLVNAKNSFGGYVGMRYFIGALGPRGFAVIGLGGGSHHAEVVEKTCRDFGLNLD